MTRFEAELAITSIEEHPKNPRHNAVADDEMVDSVREHGVLEPVIVAPHPEKPATYILIAGHRRKNAGKKAKLKDLPAIIRDDLTTEGQQIEAMIIENGHRVDLTPIEEAEGYAQLELLGYKAAGIATAVGRNVKTVRERLKLLKLSTTTQKKVHEGQLNLDDAAAFVEFAGDAEVTKELEKAAAAGQLRYAVNNVRQRRERAQVNAALIAVLIDAGATEYTAPEGKQYWQDANIRTLSSLDQPWAEHDGCLAYQATTGDWPTVTVMCLDRAKHVADPSAAPDTAEEAERLARIEQARVEREQKEAADKAAASVRVSTLLDLVGTATPLTPVLRDLIRALLPQTLWRTEDFGFIRRYQDAMNIPEADRWDDRMWDPSPMDRTLFAQHVAEINRYSDGILVRALLAVLTSDAEVNISDAPSAHTRLARSYYALLNDAGYVQAPPDQEFLTALDDAEAGEAEDDDEAAAS